MTSEECGLFHFFISMRDNNFAQSKTAAELTQKMDVALRAAIHGAVEAERESCIAAARLSPRMEWDSPAQEDMRDRIIDALRSRES